MKKHFLLSIITILFTSFSYAQNVGINNDVSAPDPSAILDVKSPDKGLLVPRVSLSGTTDATTISLPAISLLIYNTATTTGGTAVTPGFYFWNGNSWLRLITTGSALVTSWQLSGNAGTDTLINFLGTTDDRPLQFKINNIRSGYIGTETIDGNVFWGYQSGLKNTGHSNVGLGIKALFSNTSSSNLVAIGDSALYNNTAIQNTAVGSKALYSNTFGVYNTANGFSALRSNTTGAANTANGVNTLLTNTTGYANTAIGVSALYLNTNGGDNTATGVQSLTSNTEGFNNTANGSNALFSNTTGFDNTAIGYGSLEGNTEGNYNTANGFDALSHNHMGNNNTALGYSADVSVDGLTNATAIGNGAMVNASNTVQIGNSLVTDIYFGSSTATLHANTVITPSDARFKYDIKDNVPGLEFIKKLTPITYYFNEEKLNEFTKTGIINKNIIQPASYNSEKQVRTGFLAQDVEKIVKELGYSFDGVYAPANDKDHYSLAYTQFIMPLVKSVQEQQKIIEDRNKKIDSQGEQIKKMNEKIEALARVIKELTDK